MPCEDDPFIGSEAYAVAEKMATVLADYFEDAYGIDPCQIDHNGFCQAHSSKPPCIVAEARGRAGAVGGGDRMNLYDIEQQLTALAAQRDAALARADKLEEAVSRALTLLLTAVKPLPWDEDIDQVIEILKVIHE